MSSKLFKTLTELRKRKKEGRYLGYKVNLDPEHGMVVCVVPVIPADALIIDARVEGEEVVLGTAGEIMNDRFTKTVH